MEKLLKSIKEFFNNLIQCVSEVVEESRTFCAQEQPCVPPSATPCTSNSPADAMAQMQAQTISQNICSCLALHIVRLMRDLPKHFNIESYTEQVAVPLADLGNGYYAVKFYKKDAAVELKSTLFAVEIQPELNRRAEMVRLSAVQEINKAADLFYDQAYSTYYNIISSNEILLNHLNFIRMVDCGNYVVVNFSACYDCRGVNWL